MVTMLPVVLVLEGLLLQALLSLVLVIQLG